jgi:hypothetical protein
MLRLGRARLPAELCNRRGPLFTLEKSIRYYVVWRGLFYIPSTETAAPRARINFNDTIDTNGV